jgi:hypothetical protein
MVYSRMNLPDETLDTVPEFKIFENKLCKFKKHLMQFGLFN